MSELGSKLGRYLIRLIFREILTEHKVKIEVNNPFFIVMLSFIKLYKYLVFHNRVYRIRLGI